MVKATIVVGLVMAACGGMVGGADACRCSTDGDGEVGGTHWPDGGDRYGDGADYVPVV
jgi:hypothetical protein